VQAVVRVQAIEMVLCPATHGPCPETALGIDLAVIEAGVLRKVFQPVDVLELFARPVEESEAVLHRQAQAA